MPVKIFFCYAHEDEALLKKLKTHLRPLQRLGLIDLWHDRDISAGTEWEQEISEHLNTADIILLLVSSDFMDSDYCYGKEMKRAIERHERKEACVIPVILRPVYWQGVLSKLQALPKDALAVTDPGWGNIDQAFLNITEGILEIVEQMTNKPTKERVISSLKVVDELGTESANLIPLKSINKSKLIFNDGKFIMDLDKKFVQVNGREILFSRAEFVMLEALVKNKGKFLTRETLLNYVWGDISDVPLQHVDVYVNRIRRQLEDHDSGHTQFIYAKRGLGYLFDCEE